MSQPPDDNKLFWQGFLIILGAFALFAFDVMTKFDGYKLSSNTLLIQLKTLFTFVGFIALLIWNFVTGIYTDKRQIIPDFVLTTALVACGAFNIGDLNWIRLIFLYVLYKVGVESVTDDVDEKLKEKITFAALLIIDYYVLGLLGNWNTGFLNGATRYYFPVYIWYFTLFYIQKTRSAFFTFLFTLVVAFSVFSIMGGKELFYPEIQKASSSDRTSFQNALIRFGEAIAGIPLSIQKGWNETFNYDYTYDGEQEQTDNPQGVYLKEIDKGDMLFFEETPALLWAVLEARTLENPIDKVTVTCTTELEDGTINEGVVNEGATSFIFPVYTGVDRPISCRFDDLVKGNYEAKFLAEFDSTTESRQLVYLMDRTKYTEAVIDLRRRGLSATPEDVLRSVDITDTDPISIYTSGPVKVSIGTNGFPWDIGDTNNILYRFGVEIKNEWSKGGELKSINKIKFIMPQTFSIVKNSCGVAVNYDSPSIVSGNKIYETSDVITDVKDERNINCLLKVDKNSLDAQVDITRRYLKAEVDYTYIMEETTDFEVEKLHDETDQGLIDADTVCCKIGSSYSTISKTECADKSGSQSAKEKCFDECCEVKESGKSNRYYWVSSNTLCDEYDTNTAQASIVSDKSKCPPK